MKILVHLYLFQILTFVTVASLISCTNKNTKNPFDTECKNLKTYDNLKICKEPNGNFEIELPENWKREFFVSENESRFYFADTTKELSQAFISDIGLYQKRKEIDEKFKRDKIISIKNTDELNLISLKKITFQGKEGYIFHTESSITNIEKNTLEIYLQNRNKTFYLIKIDLFGLDNLPDRICNSLSIIESSKFF